MRKEEIGLREYFLTFGQKKQKIAQITLYERTRGASAFVFCQITRPQTGYIYAQAVDI